MISSSLPAFPLPERIVRNLKEGPDYSPRWRQLVIESHLLKIAEAGDPPTITGELLKGESDRVVRESLREFTDNGAAVAWVGGYECLLYYSADIDFAGCYAAYTDDTGLICRSGLDEPFRYIDSDSAAIQLLHTAVRNTIKDR